LCNVLSSQYQKSFFIAIANSFIYIIGTFWLSWSKLDFKNYLLHEFKKMPIIFIITWKLVSYFSFQFPRADINWQTTLFCTRRIYFQICIHNLKIYSFTHLFICIRYFIYFISKTVAMSLLLCRYFSFCLLFLDFNILFLHIYEFCKKCSLCGDKFKYISLYIFKFKLALVN